MAKSAYIPKNDASDTADKVKLLSDYSAAYGKFSAAVTQASNNIQSSVPDWEGTAATNFNNSLTNYITALKTTSSDMNIDDYENLYLSYSQTKRAFEKYKDDSQKYETTTSNAIWKVDGTAVTKDVYDNSQSSNKQYIEPKEQIDTTKWKDDYYSAYENYDTAMGKIQSYYNGLSN